MKLENTQLDYICNELRLRFCQAILTLEPEKLIALYEELLKTKRNAQENDNA